MSRRFLKYLNVVVVGGNWDELGQALTEPHRDVSLHVDGERLKAFLEPTDGEVA